MERRRTSSFISERKRGIQFLSRTTQGASIVAVEGKGYLYRVVRRGETREGYIFFILKNIATGERTYHEFPS